MKHTIVNSDCQIGLLPFEYLGTFRSTFGSTFEMRKLKTRVRVEAVMEEDSPTSLDVNGSPIPS